MGQLSTRTPDMKLTTRTSLGDHTLDTDRCDPYTNAELKITLRLGFRQINPPPGAPAGTYRDHGLPGGSPRKIVPWTTSSWTAWVRTFAGLAKRYWDSRFWLVNDFAELDFDRYGARYRPNIDCRFELLAVDPIGSNSHHIVDVAKLDQSERWMGSHSRLYNSHATWMVAKASDQGGKPIMQAAYAHEIGHLLGLSHVDVGKPWCPPTSNKNASACYGVHDPDKQNVMGSGMALRNEHANPWRRAICALTGKGSLTSSGDWAPMRIRIYPRTVAEAAARTQITARPVR